MHSALGVLVVLLNVADNTTTFLCLRAPTPGFELAEANPAAAWLFDAIGLVPGLVLEMAVTTAAVWFLVATTHLRPRTKLALLAVLALLPLWATLNNAYVIHATGVSLAWS